MNTQGHHDVANKVGLPMLKEVFGSRRVDAFYLGNWLTDLSQVVDPVAFESVTQKATKWIDSALDLTHFTVCDLLTMTPRFTCDEEWITKVKSSISESFTALFDKVFKPTGTETTSAWYEIAKAGLLLNGYFKFVHPEKLNDPLRMDLEAFIHVVENMFTQYYPHEHLDRPAVAASGPHAPDKTLYDARLANGPRTTTPGQTVTPDLYEYLREDIDLVAGRLTELDLKWAKKFLATPPAFDGDKEWNLGLARLGQALHAVEDYFAHSNFVELAAPAFGEKFLPKGYEVFRKRRFIKRLRRYDATKVDDEAPPFVKEDYVVTGYFDFQDTAISLLHLLEHIVPGLLGIELHDLTEDLRYAHDAFMDVDGTDKKINDAVGKFLSDALDVVEDPHKLKDKDNEVVKALTKVVNGVEVLDEIAEDLKKLNQPQMRAENLLLLLERMPLFKPLIVEMNKSAILRAIGLKILQAFVDLIHKLLRIKPEVGLAINVRKLVKELRVLAADPAVWLADKTKDAIKDYIIGSAAYIGLESIYISFGLERIGCHSLLSKDHGGEVLYDQMKACCKAVHYYVMKTLLRWRHLGGNGQVVDWLDLLEYFLCNPIVGITFTDKRLVFVAKSHVIKDEDVKRHKGQLRNLFNEIVEQYKQSVVMPPDLPPERPLKQSDIVKETFGIRVRANLKRINYVRISEDMLVPIYSPTLGGALKLRRVMIPYFQTEITTCPLTPNRWYVSIFTNTDDFEEWKPAWDNWGHGHLLKYKTDAAAGTYISDVTQRRRTLETAYNSLAQRPTPPPT